MTNYRSKRTRAQMTVKEDEVMPAATKSKQNDGGDDRWGPFQPRNDKASSLATDKQQNTVAPDKKIHKTSQIQATTSRRLVVPQPHNFQCRTVTFPPSNGTEQVPPATKSNQIWREPSNRPSMGVRVGQTTISTNRPHTAKTSTISSGPSTQDLNVTQPACTQAPIKSKSSLLPIATNRPHTAKTSTISSGPSTQDLNVTEPEPEPASTQAPISPQTNSLKSKSSLPFATDRTHTVKLKSILVNGTSETRDTPVTPPNEDLVDNVKPFKPRRHRVVIPDWPDEVAFDEKDEVMTLDKEGNYKTVSHSIQPRDVWHADGTKYFVTFNEFYQPLKTGGHILIRFIGHIAKTEQLCPINELDWRHVSAQLKVDIVKLIRDRFVIPDGELFDQAILKRTGKSVRQYRHYLKKMLFKPATKTKEQIYAAAPDGHPRPSWIRLVDYWYSDKGKKLSECGKEARANQTHMHTTGPTSYANIRADFEEKNKREASVLEIFKQTHRKKDGTFVKDTMTEDFLIDVDASIDTETLMNPSSSKSRVEIENEAFNRVMFGRDNIPTRPLGYGYGVKQSDVFGVQSILRKEGFGSGESNSLALENMKKAVSDVTKENKLLQNKYDESNVLLKKMTTQFAQILDVFSTGKATTEFIDMAKSVLNMNMAGTQVSDFSDGDDDAS